MGLSPVQLDQPVTIMCGWLGSAQISFIDMSVSAVLGGSMPDWSTLP
jgi:hypothetical protein